MRPTTIDDRYGNGGPSKPIHTPAAMMITDTAMIVMSIQSHVGTRCGCLSIVPSALSPGALWLVAAQAVVMQFTPHEGVIVIGVDGVRCARADSLIISLSILTAN